MVSALIRNSISSKAAWWLFGLAFLIMFAGNASAAIGIDQMVSKDQGTKSSTVATASFSTTSGNELLMAFVCTDAPSSNSNTTVTSIAGAGLTWVLVRRTNTQAGTAEIWRAFAPSPLASATVTATLSRSTVSSMTVISFTGVDPSGTNGSGAIGATGSGNSISWAPTASLVTTRNNSLVIGVGNDWDNAINRTPGANQTVLHQYLTPVGDTYWVQRQNSIIPASGTLVTISDTAPSTDRYNLSIAEILAPASVAPTIAATAGTPQGAMINAAFATALQATLKDASNNPVSGATVTFTAPSTGASGVFAGGVTTATTDSSGIATAATFTANSVAGGYTVTASASGVATPASFSLTNNPGVAAIITAAAGTPQSATIRTAFATALQAKVTDAASNPLSGVSVTFQAPGSGASGTFSNGTATISVTTNNSGVAAAAFTANSTAGGYTVTAKAGAIGPVNFLLTNNTGPAASIAATAGTPQSTTIGTAFGTALQATVTDAGGNLLSGVSVTFLAPGSGASGTFSNGTVTIVVTTNASGMAAATFTANSTAGSYTVTAKAGTIGPANFALTNNSGPAATVAATAGTPQGATINTAFGTALQATVKDSSNNPTSGVAVTFTAPGSGASGTFSNGTATIAVTTNNSGVATEALTANSSTGGPYIVTASVSGVTNSASFSLTNNAVPASSITATAGTPQSATVNTTFGTALQATVKNSSNNPVNGVLVTFTAPSSGASGTFAGGINTTATTNSSGVATAPAFTANAIAGSYTVIASASGATSASFSLTNTSASSGGQTLFTTQTPALLSQSDGVSVNYELGMLFQSSTAGQITAVRFWKDSKETGVHTGHIWSSTGQLLASVTYLSETASGWQQQALTTPLSINANTTYVVSTNTGNTFYVATNNGLASKVVNGNLSSVVGNNGVYGSPGSFPTNTWQASNYFRDVVFVPVMTLTVTMTRVRGGVTITQPLPLTANVQNDPANAGVTWSSSGGTLSGQTTSSATFTSTSPGVYTITATSNADGTKSATAVIGVSDLAGVSTWRNDMSRSGVNSQEFALTTQNVTTSSFGKLFSCAVDGWVFAQPLWMANVQIGGAQHNVVYVATENDSLYAFDADGPGCKAVWSTQSVNLVPSGEKIAPLTDLENDASALGPVAGITGTPVIDPTSQTIYLVALSEDSSSGAIIQRLHAIDIRTGQERTGSPKVILPTITGNGYDNSAGTITFSPRFEKQRPALLLLNGIVYVAWAGFNDTDYYHGWVVGYDASTLAQVTVFNDTRDGGRGGIWMSGGGPAADSQGNIYLLTGNGDFNANITGGRNYGDTFLKLATSGGLSVSDWFTPFNQSSLSANDMDLGGGGAVILVDQSSGIPHLTLGGGKDGILYVVNRDNLGHFNSTNNSQVVQSFVLGSNGIYSAPLFWQNTLYAAASGAPLNAYSFSTTTDQFQTTPVSACSQSFAFPGTTPALSAAGTNNAILWAIELSSTSMAVLHAYSPSNLKAEFWNSSQASNNRDKAGVAVKFTVPTIANGKVYIGTQTELDVYGLLPN